MYSFKAKTCLPRTNPGQNNIKNFLTNEVNTISGTAINYTMFWSDKIDPQQYKICIICMFFIYGLTE